jgi:hypothetical protein
MHRNGNNYDEISYLDFLDKKIHSGMDHGFDPLFMPDFLFDFQKSLVEWGTRKGRDAIFADCGLGKTPMQLVWAENVIRKTNKPVLILAPLAVSGQTVREAEKFGIECRRSIDGKPSKNITVTNYERLHYFDPNDFSGCVCDESSILKNFDGARRSEITEFMRKIPYRLLTTATASPNDYVELGTSSEALGELGYTDMLTRFFKNDQNTIRPTMYLHRGLNFQEIRDAAKWRFKGHAEVPFWRWVCSWARAIRKPSDLGFDDGRFVLPPLIEKEHFIEARSTPPGMLFNLPAIGLKEQREERRRTIQERCENAAKLVIGTGRPALLWCNLNDEGDLLEEMIPDAVQVSGKDSDEDKEEKLMAFSDEKARVLITKPKIGAWGLNFQHCAHIVLFPTHSFEQYYQGVRRCWRFGQTRPVQVDIIATEGDKLVMSNLQRKAKAADKMFAQLVEHMQEALAIDRSQLFTQKEEIPSWL